jgi:hypothetical protein
MWIYFLSTVWPPIIDMNVIAVPPPQPPAALFDGPAHPADPPPPVAKTIAARVPEVGTYVPEYPTKAGVRN